MIQKKIALLGMYGVGKTSLVQRFLSNQFNEKYLATIGVKIDKKLVTIQNQDVTLMLWDIAGAEKDFTVPTSFLRGAAGYLLVIDGTRADTLSRGLGLVSQVKDELGSIPFVALLNKSDLTDQWQLKDEHTAQLHTLGCQVINSSALTGAGVEAAFHALAEQIVS